MSTGKIKDLFPPGNNGQRAGSGAIEEYIGGVPQGKPYVRFNTPKDNNNSILKIDADVTFNKTGQTADGVTPAPVAAPITCTLTSPSPSTLTWTSSGADTVILNPNNMTLKPAGGGTISIGPGTYTITASNSTTGATPVTSDPVTVTG